MSDPTKSYYRANFVQFIENTVEIDLQPVYQQFLPLIPENGEILDAGCGSGRDSIFFSRLGYRVTAIDNCPEFVEKLGPLPGIEAQLLAFGEIDFENRFSAIWACASLLHLPVTELRDAFRRLVKALKADGIFYASFKYGDFSGLRNGRFFTDLTEESFAELVRDFENLEVSKYWQTVDQRPERKAEKWLNVLLRKK